MQKMRSSNCVVDNRAMTCCLTFVLIIAFSLWLPLPGNAQSGAFKVGVLPFTDNTGSSAADIANSISRAVQAEMVHSTPLLGRVITLDAGTDPSSIDANKAVALGRAQSVDVVIVGTVLEATAEQSGKSANLPSFGGISLGGNKQTVKATVTLQADLYSTSTGQKIDSIRQTESASESKIGTDVNTGLGGLNTGGASFDNSAMGKAFHAVVASIVKKINGEQAQMAHYSPGAAASPSAAAASSAAAPAASAAPASASASASAQPVGASGAAAGGQPELRATKIEFVSGEKTVFFDDFSDMAADEPPPHWKVREGTVELRTGGGIRELYADKGVELTSPSVVIPTNFTFELVWTGGGEMAWHFRDKNNAEVLVATVRGEESGQEANASVSGPDGGLGEGGIQTDTSQPVTFALWAQQGRVRALPQRTANCGYQPGELWSAGQRFRELCGLPAQRHAQRAHRGVGTGLLDGDQCQRQICDAWDQFRHRQRPPEAGVLRCAQDGCGWFDQEPQFEAGNRRVYGFGGR